MTTRQSSTVMGEEWGVVSISVRCRLLTYVFTPFLSLLDVYSLVHYVTFYSLYYNPLIQMSISNNLRSTNVTVYVDHYSANDCNLSMYDNGECIADECISIAASESVLSVCKANGATILYI